MTHMTSPLILAAIAALVASLPLALANLPAAVGLFAASIVIDWPILYLATPATSLPFLGLAGVLAIVWSLVGAGVAVGAGGDHPDLRAVPIIATAVLVLTFVGTWLGGSSLFHAAEYAGLAGQVPTSEWTRDIQPKDPAHMVMVPLDTALYEARKAVSQDGAIGSQFSISQEDVTLQQVNGRMTYAIPLDFNSWRTWSATGSMPGWIEVDAEDPNLQPRFVAPQAGRPITITRGAYFSHDLVRAVRDAGYGGQVAGVRFEVDGDHLPWWVVTLTHPTHGWDGDVVDTVLVVDPSTGAVTPHGLGDLPPYVDAAVPADLVRKWLAFKGELAGGAWNSLWGRFGLTEPEDPILVAGNGGRPVWVTGMTSTNGHDESLVSLVYTDPRSGTSVTYAMNGGATEAAARTAADHNADIGYKRLVATVPQVYNVEGVPTAVMPLVNATGAFQGVAMAQLSNVQDVAFGQDQTSALDAYKAIILRRGVQTGVETASASEHVTGVVDRISPAPGNGRAYQFHLAGVGRIFTASASDDPSLALTQPGDRVSFVTVASGSVVLPATGFKNATLPLDAPGR